MIFFVNEIVESSAGAVAAGASGTCIGERRHSSTATQDLNEYIYSVPEDNDAIIEDDDVFEMEPAEAAAEAAELAAKAAASAASSEAKRRTQSLGSLTAEPKSPRKVSFFSPSMKWLREWKCCPFIHQTGLFIIDRFIHNQGPDFLCIYRIYMSWG